MGFFSWLKSDDQKPIRNKWTDDGPTPVKMIDDKGNEWVERNYDGYGIFGGMDYYELLSKMNDEFPKELESCAGDHRDHGIELAFSGQDIKRPKLVSIDCKTPWVDLRDPIDDPNQGYFDW